MKRVIDNIGLLFVSVGAMIGSGWMLTPLIAAKMAGPWSVLAWIIGGSLIMIVATTFAELSAMFPCTGGIARYPYFSHGNFPCFVMTWITWLAAIMIPPTEVTAILQYLSNSFPWLLASTTNHVHLSNWGILAATFILFFISLINLLSIKLVINFNKILVYFKIAIPLITSLILLNLDFHSNNFFIPITGNVYLKILHVLPLSGIIFSFFGFRLSVDLGGEVKDPYKTLPLSLFGSIMIGIIIYTIVQIAFIGAINGDKLNNNWHNLTNLHYTAPFIQILTFLGIGWLINLLLLNAIIAPVSSSLMVVTTNARLCYAMGQNKFFPAGVMQLNKHNVPFMAVIVNFICGLFLLLPFPSWQNLALAITSCLVLSHAIAPIVVIALRQQLPQQKRPFKLKAAKFICNLSFIILNLLFYWSGWQVIYQMLIGLMVGIILWFGLNWKNLLYGKDLQLAKSWWILIYIIGLITISYNGDSRFGGNNNILFGYDIIIIFIFSIIVFKISTHKSVLLSTEKIRENIASEN